MWSLPRSWVIGATFKYELLFGATEHVWRTTKCRFNSIKRNTFNYYLVHQRLERRCSKSLLVFNPWLFYPLRGPLFLSEIFACRASRCTFPSPPPYLSGPGKNTKVLRETSVRDERTGAVAERFLHFSLTHNLATPSSSTPCLSHPSPCESKDISYLIALS